MKVSEQELPKGVRWLVQEWASRFAQSVESMTGTAPTVEWESVAEIPEGLEWWEQPLSVTAGASLWTGGNQADWDAVGKKALEAAGVEQPEPAEVRSTFLEILSQAVSVTAQNLGGLLGREVAAAGGRQAETPAAGHAVVARVGLGPAEVSTLYLVASASLAGTLDPASREQAGASAAAPASSAAPPPENGPQVAGSKTLDLLLEVEMPVSVSFGRAQLPLKDVLKLTTGSIVELNRAVSEPVEVIVNNCVIARGEVVVVEGNYGVRIGEIISRQERLRSLY